MIKINDKERINEINNIESIEKLINLFLNNKIY